MKKLSVILVAILMVVAMSFSAFAAPDNFIESPGASQGPELIEYENEDHECVAELVVTPYSERETLSEDLEDQIVDAYYEIINADDLTGLNEELANIAETMGIPASDLAVSELFDIHYESCPEHSEHGSFKIKLRPEVLENFVGLLHCHDGVWHLVDGAKVENEEYLVFSIKDFSPFAIVVNNGDDTSADSPLTGFAENNGKVIGLVAVMTVSLVACVVLWKKSRKQAA